jgi:DNA-binding transcriptional LysR family regulator
LGPSFDLTMNLIVAAKSGMGVAVVPACLVQLELIKGELVKPFDTEVSCGRGYFLCRHKDAPHFDAGDRFADWLVKQTADDHFHGAL